jgi:hypothetical protein
MGSVRLVALKFLGQWGKGDSMGAVRAIDGKGEKAKYSNYGKESVEHWDYY